jgi:hypothetical protein
MYDLPVAASVNEWNIFDLRCSLAPSLFYLMVTLLPVILVQNQIIYIIIGKVHTLVQCASVEVKVLGS